MWYKTFNWISNKSQCKFGNSHGTFFEMSDHEGQALQIKNMVNKASNKKFIIKKVGIFLKKTFNFSINFWKLDWFYRSNWAKIQYISWYIDILFLYCFCQKDNETNNNQKTWIRLEIKAENEQTIIMSQIARKTNSKTLFSKLNAKRKLLIIQKLLTY